MAEKKAANSLVALSSAAVLAVYAAGYVRTRSAADRFALQAAVRRPAPGGPPNTPANADPSARPAQKLTSPPVPLPASAVLKATAVKPAPASKIESAPLAAAVPAPAQTGGDAAIAVPEQQAAPPETPPEPPKSELKDGIYLGWGHCRHGDIEAEVIVAEGRITSASISQCLTRYSCSMIERLSTQVTSRQSPEVDYVSGATESTDAFYFAVVDALSKAR